MANNNDVVYTFVKSKTNIARRLRAKFWPDCAIPDTRLNFGTVVDYNRLSSIGYRTTLGNAYSRAKTKGNTKCTPCSLQINFI